MKFKRFLSIILLSIMILFTFGGCAKKVSYDDIKPYSDELVKNSLVAMTDKNYNEFIVNFGDDTKASLTEDFFNTDLKKTTDAIGDFQGNIEFLKAQSKQGYIQAAYKASFSGEPDGVIVTVTFKEDANPKKLEGIFLKSPKIIEASKK